MASKDCTNCSQCSAEGRTTRLPMGWHRDPDGRPYCKKCWNQRYVLRAITFRVAGPVNCEWPALRESLRTCWQTATRVANWCVRELAKADVVRTPDMNKLPKMPRTYLYGLANEHGINKGLDSQSASSVMRMAEQKYRAQRYDAIWLGKASTLSFRYPVPYPIHNASWSLKIDQERLVLSVRLNGDRTQLVLSGGHGFRRQRKAAEKLINGQAIAGEAAIYEVRSQKSDHRNGTNGRDSGGQKSSSRVMAKLVMWLPREPHTKKTGTLRVRTDNESLLVALNETDEKLWIYNGDHLRRWCAEHRRRLQRWSDDTKAENQPPRFNSRRDESCLKFRRRLDSATHEISAQVVGYAKRRRFAVLRYNDAEQQYLDKFPYFQLRERIAAKCDEAGIIFECSSDEKKAGSSRKIAKVKP